VLLRRRRAHVDSQSHRSTARSDKPFDDAIRSGIAKASGIVRGIREAWGEGHKVMVEGDAVVAATGST
jgi:hypothetical protein